MGVREIDGHDVVRPGTRRQKMASVVYRDGDLQALVVAEVLFGEEGAAATIAGKILTASMCSMPS